MSEIDDLKNGMARTNIYIAELQAERDAALRRVETLEKVIHDELTQEIINRYPVILNRLAEK